MTVPHPDPKPLEPWALELLRQDGDGADPETREELARLVALLRALPDPAPSPDLTGRILAQVAARESRPRVIRAAFGAWRQLARPAVAAPLAAGIAAMFAFVLAPDSTPSVLRQAGSTIGGHEIAGAARRRGPLIRPQYVSAAFAQTPSAMPRLRPERSPIEDAFDARLDHQLNQLMLDPTAFAQRLELVAQRDRFMARLAQRAAERGDAPEIAFRVRASHHPLAGEMVERLLSATLVESVSGR